MYNCWQHEACTCRLVYVIYIHLCVQQDVSEVFGSHVFCSLLLLTPLLPATDTEAFNPPLQVDAGTCNSRFTAAAIIAFHNAAATPQ